MLWLLCGIAAAAALLVLGGAIMFSASPTTGTTPNQQQQQQQTPPATSSSSSAAGGNKQSSSEKKSAKSGDNSRSGRKTSAKGRGSSRSSSNSSSSGHSSKTPANDKQQKLARKIAEAIIKDNNLSTITDTEISELMAAGYDVLNQDPARVSVKSPCYVFGDIHGNLPYLIKFFSHAKVEPQLLELKPPLASLLFLGDYVDRGVHSLEVVSLLVSLKVLFADKIFLLRGNHEIMELNKMYSFQKEVEKKRKNKRIYEQCNKLFTNLPLCAIISNSFLCMHGGLPRPEAWDHLMSDNFVKPKDDTELDSNIVFCDLLWADPTNNSNELRLNKDFKPDSEFAGDYGNYRHNLDRATSIEFNDRFVHQFINHFPNICAIIRAHEQCTQGYRINEARNVCTVFSSPRYETAVDSGSVLKVSNDLKRLHFLTLKPTEGLKDCQVTTTNGEVKNCE